MLTKLLTKDQQQDSDFIKNQQLERLADKIMFEDLKNIEIPNFAFDRYVEYLKRIDPKGDICPYVKCLIDHLEIMGCRVYPLRSGLQQGKK